uniref:Uncharacterized protein n=1 Tax=Arundo donax TaxID=35708 RepID=A0A0A9FLF4_ARUDO
MSSSSAPSGLTPTTWQWSIHRNLRLWQQRNGGDWKVKVQLESLRTLSLSKQCRNMSPLWIALAGIRVNP